jgi:N-methylhydantoinase A
VTDADLVLGYLSDTDFAGGSMHLDAAAAHDAIDARVARPLGVGVHEAALAIHDIANADMAAAIHVVTVQRGIDPRRYALVATGGAAAMHACRVASRFDMTTVIVPPHAGVASAIGLVRTDLLAERSRSLLVDLATADPARIDAVFEALTAAAAADLAAGRAEVQVERSVAMRFVGQAHELEVRLDAGPVDAARLARLEHAFLAEYRRAFGIDAHGPVQLVSFRAQVRLPVEDPSGAAVGAVGRTGRTVRRAWFAELGGATDTPVIARSGAAVGSHEVGPLILEAEDSTTVVPPGWTCDVHLTGALFLRRSEVAR